MIVESLNSRESGDTRGRRSSDWCSDWCSRSNNNMQQLAAITKAVVAWQHQTVHCYGQHECEVKTGTATVAEVDVRTEAQQWRKQKNNN